MLPVFIVQMFPGAGFDKEHIHVLQFLNSIAFYFCTMSTALCKNSLHVNSVYCSFCRSEGISLHLKMAADTSVEILQKVLENEILQTTKVVEEHLDAEMQKLDQMDEDELERLKQRRLEALKKAKQQKQVSLVLIQTPEVQNVIVFGNPRGTVLMT